VADKKTIGIDLGHEALKYVAVSITSDKPKIESYKSADLNLAADADASAWREAVINVLNSWKGENLIKPGDELYVTAPNDQVLIRALKIKTEDIKTQLEQEADKQIPVSLDEVDWDSVTVAEENGESHLVLAAVKKVVVENIISMLAEVGLEPSSIDCGAMAIGNVYLNSSGGEAEVPAVILNIGATASDLVIVDGKKVWIRTLPVTGKSIVSSVSKNLNMSEEEAKKAISSKVNLSAPAGEESDITKNVRATMSRLVMEITRSLTFFKSQIGGEKPQKILVCGGYSNIPGLTDFLSGRLKIDASELNVFQTFGETNVEKSSLYAQALGCALAGAGLTSYALNVLPKGVQLQQSLNRKKVWIAASAYIFAAIFIALFAIVSLKSKEIENQAEIANSEVSKVSSLSSKISKIQKKIAKKQIEIDEIHRVILSRDLYVKALQNISEIIPSNMWISGIENITFGDIYEKESLESDDSGPNSIVIDDKSEVYNRPVRLLIRGGYYGDWIEEMPKVKKKFAKVPGFAGFTQRRLIKEKKYSTFELDIDLDSNYNDKPDLADIKESFSRKGRSGRR